MNKKREVGRVILLTLAFWALVVFGPIIVYLVNAFQPFYMRYRPGDLGYLLMVVISQGIACGFAISAAYSIGDDRHTTAIFVNEIVGATFLGFGGAFELILQKWQTAIALLLGMIVLIVGAVYTAKELWKQNGEKAE